MPWFKCAPRLYRRALNGAEKQQIAWITSKAATQREPIKIQAILDLTSTSSTNEIAAALRIAWIAQRFRHCPEIAATFEGCEWKQYLVPDNEQLEEWLQESFRVSSGKSVQEVVQSMHTDPTWLPVCYLISQSPSQEPFSGSIALFISHWRTEAGGAFMILDQLLTDVSSILNNNFNMTPLTEHTSGLGEETTLLVPAIEEMMLEGRETTPAVRERVAQRFEKFYDQIPNVGYSVINDAAAEPAEVQFIQRQYSASSTAALIAACRSHRITVTAAVHSAFLGSVWAQAAEEDKSRPYTCMMPAEVRKRLPESSTPRTQGCWNAAQMLLISVPSGQTFLSTARDLRNQYEMANTDAWLYEDMEATSAQLLVSHPNAVNMPPSAAWFTSLGVLDIAEAHDKIQVHDVTVWADPVGPGIVLRVWTFAGRFNMQTPWNIAYHKIEQITKTIDYIEALIWQELHVQLEIEKVRHEIC